MRQRGGKGSVAVQVRRSGGGWRKVGRETGNFLLLNRSYRGLRATGRIVELVRIDLAFLCGRRFEDELPGAALGVWRRVQRDDSSRVDVAFSGETMCRVGLGLSLRIRGCCLRDQRDSVHLEISHEIAMKACCRDLHRNPAQLFCGNCRRD